jgi:uncharacterized membrane protein
VRSLRHRAPLALAAVFTTSGVVHLVRPQAFASIMPRAIPEEHHTTLIYASGLVELACAAGLVLRTRWAAAASVATLAAVFPANVQMALDAGTGRNPGPTDSRAVAWGRLPLQLVMAWMALQARSRPDLD